MRATPEDPDREHRIEMEIVVDCYNEEEAAMGWYCTLDDRLAFPFTARCVAGHSVSPLLEGETVEVVGMADSDDCLCEMFVEVVWQGREFGVPLAQLEAVDAGADPRRDQAMADWRYWTDRGYSLC